MCKSGNETKARKRERVYSRCRRRLPDIPSREWNKLDYAVARASYVFKGVGGIIILPLIFLTPESTRNPGVAHELSLLSPLSPLLPRPHHCTSIAGNPSPPPESHPSLLCR